MNPMMLRALKGAPLAVLVALATIHRAGPDTLSTWTGYDRKTTSRALTTLQQMGLVEHGGRYDGYRLTANAQQLPLWTPGELETGEGEFLPVEGENLPLPLCSSSSSLINARVNKLKQLLPQSEGENIPLPPELAAAAEEIATELASSTGYTFARILADVSHALSQGDPPAQIRADAAGWIRFARTKKGIYNPGAFVCARIRTGQPPPDPHGLEAAIKATEAYEVPEGYEDLISH